MHDITALVREAIAKGPWGDEPTTTQLFQVEQALRRAVQERGPTVPHRALQHESILDALAQLVSAEEMEDLCDDLEARNCDQDDTLWPETLAQFSATEVARSMRGTRGIWAPVSPNTGLVAPPSESRVFRSMQVQILTWVTALLGTPVECHRNSPHALIRWIADEHCAIAVPQYTWYHDGSTSWHGSTVVLRDRYAAPLSSLEWMRSLLFTGPRGFRAVRNWHFKHKPLFCDIHCIAKNPHTWDHAVRVLQRDTLPRIPWSPHTAAQPLEQWYGNLFQRLGTPKPQLSLVHMTPLRAQLFDHMPDDADGFTRHSEQSALQLSDQAQSKGWTRTVQHMLDEIHAQLHPYATIFTSFVGYRGEGQFSLHSKAGDALDDMQESILRSIAAIAAIDGVPRCFTGDDCPTPAYTEVIARLGMDDYFVIIPIFHWGEPGSTPFFHGVVVAVRERSAGAPSTSEWLQWQYACQCMGLPLETIGTLGDQEQQFRSIDVQRSHNVTRSISDEFLTPNICGWRKTPKKRPSEF